MTITIARIGFLLLSLFEGLNYLRVFHFTLVYTWFGLLVTMLMGWALLEITHRYRPHHPASWFLGLGIAMNDMGGDMFKLYATIPHYDKYVHFFVSAAVTVMMLLFVRQRGERVTIRASWLAGTTVVSLGALYDLEEYWESIIFHTNRWGGGTDTMLDLSANTAGVLLALASVAIALRKRAATPQ